MTFGVQDRRASLQTTSAAAAGIGLVDTVRAAATQGATEAAPTATEGVIEEVLTPEATEEGS